MTSEIRSKAPAGWILLPVLLASGVSALAGWATDSLPLAAAVALSAGLPASWWARRRPRAVGAPIAPSPSRDPSAALPARIGNRPPTQIAPAAERLPQSLLD